MNPPRLLAILLLPASAVAVTPSATRQAIEFGQDITLFRAADEPPFAKADVKTCTVNREHGFSLLTPGFADGMAGVNFVKTPASWLNESAVVCHLGLARNATGKALSSPAITAGVSTVIVDMGGSACDIALHKWCGDLFQKGPSCWTCAHNVHRNQTKAAGCDKGAYKSFCGPQTQSEKSATVLAAHRRLAAQGLGLGHKGPCMSGPYVCATIEHFAAFAPAFARRPFIREKNLTLVVQTDSSLDGQQLTLSTDIAGTHLSRDFAGGGYARLEFPMPTLPSVNYSQTVNITLTLPDGRQRSKPRRFMHAAPPAAGMATSTVQVDHESGGLLMDGVRKTCNGWFNNPNGGIAGLPASETCEIARTDSLENQARRAAKNQAAQVADQGMKGITFLRDGIMVECPEFDHNCFNTPAYERDWANRMEWLDAAAAAGVHVLMWVGVDHLSSCRSGWIDGVRRPQNVHALMYNGSCYLDGVPQPEIIARYEAWVFDAVKRLRDHPAIAGYYGCDDCCHTVRGTYCAKEYRGIAKIREEIFALDPYHPTFGTSACGEVWMWQEEGFGLGLDVVMKEGYAGLIGASSPTFTGTPNTMKAYPMTLEPLWACGDDAGSPQALRSTVYGKALTQGTDNSFYVGTDRTANGRNWQIMAATETVSTELQSLTGSVRSRAHWNLDYVQPTAACVHGVVLPTPEYKPQPNGSFSNLVSARVFQEEQPRGMNESAAERYFCYVVISINVKPFPFFATLQIDHLRLPPIVLPKPGTTTQLPLTRLFKGTCKSAQACTNFDVNATLFPNGTAILTDMYDVETTNIYRLGCQLELLRSPIAPGELCMGGGAGNHGGNDCDFELGDLARGLYMPAWQETMLMEFNKTDYRQYISLDSADPYHGRHSARINAPNTDVLLMPVETANDKAFKAGDLTVAGRYRVRFAARSSPAGAVAGAIFEQFAPHGPAISGPPSLTALEKNGMTLSTEWHVIETVVTATPVNCSAPVQCGKVPLLLWARSPFATGALIGVDDISVVKLS